MTPITFVSFLISLALVDFHYTAMRTHSHAEVPSHMPAWLHQILYRPVPYQYVKVEREVKHKPAEAGSGSSTDQWYYHSKQKKLIKMEVADAFEIRAIVLVVLGLVAAVLTWVVWIGATWLWHSSSS
jgi:hypothetical protein